MTRRRAIGLGLLVLAIGAVAAAEVLTASGGAKRRPAPPLPSEVLSGPRTTLASLRGKPAVVNFWASWCAPCKQEAPELKRFDRTVGARARMIGVDAGDDTAGNARAFVTKSGWTYPVLRDSSQKVAQAYGLAGLPTTFVLDSHGDIVQTLQGPQTVSSLRRALASAS